MGLFRKKHSCALCDKKVRGLFSWNFGDQYVCNTCYGAVDLPVGAVNEMSLDQFRSYIWFREENQKLKDRFHVTQKVDLGVFEDKPVFDFDNRLFCKDKGLDSTVFEGQQIKSFVIKEDTIPLYEGDPSGFRYYPSTVPERVMTLAPQIELFRKKVETHERMERERSRRVSDRSVAKKGQHPDADHRPDRTPPPPSAPSFDCPEPFNRFQIEIYLDHPYWSVLKLECDGPHFSSTNPSVQDYLSSYTSAVSRMEELANALMCIAFPPADAHPSAGDVKSTAPLVPNNSDQQPREDPTLVTPEAPTMSAEPTTLVDPVMPSVSSTLEIAGTEETRDLAADLKVYKDLLDQGILTEEEFTAKKRQMLNI